METLRIVVYVEIIQNSMSILVTKVKIYFTYFHSTLHTRQSSMQSDKYQVSHRYSYFS